MPDTVAGEDILLKHIFVTTLSAPKPANFQIGLFTSDPSSSAAREVATTNGYSRVTIPNNTATLQVALDRNGKPQCSNKVEITFPTSTGAWESGAPITHGALYRNNFASPAALVMIWSGALVDTFSVHSAGARYRFAVGELVFSIN